jgi:preprotein translocase subunit SecA
MDKKNPLIEYKSESYNFFQELMVSLRSTVIQRVFHAQVSDQVQTQQNPLQKNIQLKHDEAEKSDSNDEIPKNILPKEDMSNESELKLGRNDKVELIAPSGERVKVKFKKINQYLMKGYTRG